MKRLLITVAAVALFVGSVAPRASADTIDFSTATGGWTITGAGATNTTADVLGGGAISFTSNGLETGTFIPGASLADFDGFWTASFSFFLPLDITDLSASFSNLRADDRVALLINGVPIGDGGLGIPTSGSILGKMELTDGGGDMPFTFSSGDAADSCSGFIDCSPLMLGGVNTFEAIVNNTGSGVTGTTSTFRGEGDGATFRVTGKVTYDTTPEPASLFLFGTGVVGLVGRRLRRRRNA